MFAIFLLIFQDCFFSFLIDKESFYVILNNKIKMIS